MNEKNTTSPLDAALAQVDPERRRLLGMLLAGVAAAPLLTSTNLIAEGEPDGQKAATWTKGGMAAKGGHGQKAATWTKGGITANGQKAATWTKGGITANDQKTAAWTKGGIADKYDKSGNQTMKYDAIKVKPGNPAVKSDVFEFKTQTPPKQ